jgi:hypothetical protein
VRRSALEGERGSSDDGCGYDAPAMTCANAATDAPRLVARGWRMLFSALAVFLSWWPMWFRVQVALDERQNHAASLAIAYGLWFVIVSWYFAAFSAMVRIDLARSLRFTLVMVAVVLAPMVLFWTRLPTVVAGWLG